MALLETSNLSKIYTTDGNISVGISKVNLMFDKNEIVAITGGSGSGKSTLLRVLGGLESYEEGEMYFKGLPTSHYNQQDWAEYLNTNISFIFQEYNILESFTVLENVMYALTNIKSKKERKKRAVEIIEKVGLKDRIKAKGAQLSGGEKQRTVIARAIAKDSPIILADEPTGNLDSKTANDIIDLLQDISKDKLVVIVTHNYEDVKRITTRHIRLFDGKVELDEGEAIEHESSQKSDPFDFKEEREFIFKDNKKKKEGAGFASDAFVLGAKRYSSRPKQNFLTSFLLIVASLIIFVVCVALIPAADHQGDIINQQGRLLVVKKDGTEFTLGTLGAMQAQTGAVDSILFDSALDKVFYEGEKMPEGYLQDKAVKYKLGFDLNYALDEGQQVSAPGEVVLKVPYTMKGKFSVGDELTLTGQYADNNQNGGGMYPGSPEMSNGSVTTFKSKVVGITYYLGSKIVYVDMHKNSAQEIALRTKNNITLTIIMKDNDMYNSYVNIMACAVKVDAALTGNNAKLYVPYQGDTSTIIGVRYGTCSDNSMAEKLDPLDININKVVEMDDEERWQNGDRAVIKVSPEVFHSSIVPKAVNENTSRQVSLYFNTKDEAKAASETLAGDNATYLTFLASSYKEASPKLGVPMVVALVVAGVISLVIVLSLVKIISGTKSEISIYRTMGISNSVIKWSTYVQVVLDTIPAILTMVIAYFVCFFTKLGESINFMPLSTIILLCLMVLAMGVIVAIGFNRVIYKEKINKGLRRTNK